MLLLWYREKRITVKMMRIAIKNRSKDLSARLRPCFSRSSTSKVRALTTEACPEQRGRVVTRLPLREPSILMQPERLGAFWQTRLSFARQLTKRIVQNRWKIEPIKFDLDDEGRGEVIYRIQTHERDLHLVLFSNCLSEEEREDRVIAERWDVAAALCQGEMTSERLAQMSHNVPKQEYGRADPDTLVWTRANRSSRFFNHVVNSLAAGDQPDVDYLAKGGYIMRSTAFYANTKFGLSAFESLPPQHALSGSFQAQMFTAFMLRHYACDLAEHIARTRNPNAAPLDPAIKRFLGLGNATGMGLVPFVINRPHLTHIWICLREIALASAKIEQPTPDGADTEQLRQLLARTLTYFHQDTTDGKGIFTSSDTLLADLTRIKERVEEFALQGTMGGKPPTNAWNALCEWAADCLDIESQELLHSLLIELYPETAEQLAPYLDVPELFDVMPEMQVAQLQALLERDYRWALEMDLSSTEARHYFWYYSADSEEPLIGVRGMEAGVEYERPVDIPFRVQQLARDLSHMAPQKTIGSFLARHPQHRFIVQRVQSLQDYPYAEIRTNLLAADFMPLYLQRFQLAMYGMERYQPQSTRWVRVTLMQGAPTVEDVANGIDGHGMFPLKPRV